MQIPERTRFIGDEDELDIWWEVNGTLIDFSAIGWTWSAGLTTYDNRSTWIFQGKTTGFTGQLGSGTPASGTPNLIVEFSIVDEMNLVTEPGKYVFQIVATDSNGAETTFQCVFRMRERLG